jgi:SAM-dependent methyltransferase
MRRCLQSRIRGTGDEPGADVISRWVLTAVVRTHRGGLVEEVPEAYQHRRKLEILLGADVWNEIRGKRVVDFGCGTGDDAIEMAERGAIHVFGIDIREKWLRRAEAYSRARSVEDRCTFMPTWSSGTPVDVIVSLDTFEHLDDPRAVLRMMHQMLTPTGCVLIAFGPPWYHPYGGHLYSVFPWAHCILSERVLVDWRSNLPRKTRVSTFEESGLNKMTVRRFEKLIAESDFDVVSFEAVPIRPLRWVSNRLTREFTTSIVRCRLSPRADARIMNG